MCVFSDLSFGGRYVKMLLVFNHKTSIDTLHIIVRSRTDCKDIYVFDVVRDLSAVAVGGKCAKIIFSTETVIACVAKI